MNYMNFRFIIVLFVFSFITACKPAPKTFSDNSDYNQNVSFKNMRTPSGERLLPAEEGQERSVLGVPSIDLKTFKLEITGLVDSSFSLTWDEIRSMPEAFSDTIIMYCVEGWEVWGNWEGIKVKDLLDKARIRQDGEYVLFRSVDGYTTTLPVSYLIRYNAILAYNVNGSPLKLNDGFPLRLIAFGKFGYKWAKWVNGLEVIKQSQAGFWETTGFSEQADVPLFRRRHYEGQKAKPLEY
jgi:DMSO/TMAO reductase YedYZ molybdopterin-dependent catalytic subunit